MDLSVVSNVAHWAGRIAGLLFFILIAVFVVGHAVSPDGLPNLWRAPLDVQLDFLALLLMVIGGLVGWKSPFAATVIILIGYALWQFVERRLPWPPSAFEIPLVIVLLYAVAWWSTKHAASPQQPAMP